MTLNILKDYKVVSNLEDCIISIGMLQFPSTHLFIASNKWDKVYIEVSDEIPLGSLRFINTVTQTIEVNIPDVTTETTMRILTEIYPEKSGKLRRHQMQGLPLKEALC